MRISLGIRKTTFFFLAKIQQVFREVTDEWILEQIRAGVEMLENGFVCELFFGSGKQLEL